MSLSPKKPVQPWIPERKAAPAAQKRRVVAKAGLSADGAIKAGWWLCILSGLLIGVLATVAVATATMESEAGQIAGAVAITGGYYVALVLYSVGGLAHTVLCIVAMVRGAVGRALFLLFVGPLLAVALALGPPMAAAAVLDLQRKNARPVAPIGEKKPKPQAKAAVDPVKSALRADAILEGARRVLMVRDEGSYQAAKRDAYAQAAQDPDLTEKDRERVRTALEGIYAEAEAKRARRP